MPTISDASSYDCSLTRSARKQAGVYYTPPSIVRHIVERTLQPLLEKCADVEDVLRLTVYDPACGDGRFLVESRERLLERVTVLGHERTAEIEEEIGHRCLRGADIDQTALNLARVRLPGARLVHTDSLRADSDDRFDAVLGNPPYGAALASGGESARLFIAHALRRLKPNGRHSFIVPKALLYSSAWRASLERLMPGLIELVDCGKAWPEVKLEQVIYLYASDAEGRTAYRSATWDGERVQGLGDIEKESFGEFGFALNGISAEELRLARKIRAVGATLGQLSRNVRGSPLQGLLQERGAVPVYGGRELSRYRLSPKPRGFVTEKLAAAHPAATARSCLLVQNIVAHVLRPTPRLKIAAALAPGGSDVLVLDTINKISWNGPYSPEAALALLNSRLIAWYVYRFIVGRAVRTIHFDGPVTSRIPFPRALPNSVDETLTSLVREMARSPSDALDAEIDELVSSVYGLGKGEARAVRV